MPAPRKCISVSPLRQSPIPTITALTRRNATSSWRRPTISKACAASSAPIHSRSCRSRGSIAPWVTSSAIPCDRNSPTIALPVIIRPRSPTRPGGKRRRANCRCSPKRVDARRFPPVREARCPRSSSCEFFVSAHYGFRLSRAVTLARAKRDRVPGPNEERAPMSPPLADRVALVTGASRGIGYATALALAKAGAHIVALARTVGGLEELDDAIKAAGGSATLVPLDLKDYAGIDRLGLALRERFRPLHLLRGNAGILVPLSPLRHVDVKTWDGVMAANGTPN